MVFTWTCKSWRDVWQNIIDLLPDDLKVIKSSYTGSAMFEDMRLRRFPVINQTSFAMIDRRSTCAKQYIPFEWGEWGGGGGVNNKLVQPIMALSIDYHFYYHLPILNAASCILDKSPFSLLCFSRRLSNTCACSILRGFVDSIRVIPLARLPLCCFRIPSNRASTSSKSFCTNDWWERILYDLDLWPLLKAISATPALLQVLLWNCLKHLQPWHSLTLEFTGFEVNVLIFLVKCFWICNEHLVDKRQLVAKLCLEEVARQPVIVGVCSRICWQQVLVHNSFSVKRRQAMVDIAHTHIWKQKVIFCILVYFE